MSLQLFARNGFTYGKLFHQLEEIVSELSPLLMEILRSDTHQSFFQVSYSYTSFVRPSRELAESFLTVPWASPSSHALAVVTFPARHLITVTVAGAMPHAHSPHTQ